MAILALMEEKSHILIIGFVWPEPQSSAAGKRMMQLISLFRKRDWKITFACAAAESEHAADLDSRGIDCRSVKINSSSFDDFITSLNPDIVIFDRFVTEEQFGWRVAKNCPDVVRILDTEDLHCLRRTRKKALKEARDVEQQDLLSAKDARREIASIYRSDLTLMISEFEMDLLKNAFQVDSELLYYLPFLLDPVDESDQKEWPDFQSRDHFVTIGNFQHGPNMDAVEYLKDEIWPRISRELPQAELHIYGAYPTQRAKKLHQPEERFFIEGRVEDAKKVVRLAKVLLAPLRYGAGLKGKLVEAMQCGTPSVTTDIGAEGINGSFAWCGNIENDPCDFAVASVKLFTDKAAWQQAQYQGIQIINKRFARSEFEADFMERLRSIRRNLPGHRLQNFTGQMLMHHTTSSSEYMSRWIEEKNSSKERY